MQGTLLTWPMPGAVKRRSICLPVARAASRADKAAAKISAHAHNLKKSASDLKESKREVRWLVRVCACLSHEATQLLVYIAYILTFQVLSTTLVSCGRSQTTVPGALLSLAPEPCLGQRHSSEHFGTKFIYDLLLEAPFLLRAGADVGAKNNDGKTPLNRAASNGHEAVVRAIEGIRRVSYYSDS